VPFIPESAPFNPSQRAWLNGFFAGVFSAGATTNVAVATGLLPTAESPVAAAVEEDFPWHDASLSMDERLKLAQGKPMCGQLMAAMAQLDCGSCGYLCQTYAEAIACGEENDLTRCSPGGADTANKLKQLVVLNIAVPTKNGYAQPIAAPASKAKYDRNRPY